MAPQLKWQKIDYSSHLKSGPFSLIKRRSAGRYFWIARVEVCSVGLDSRAYRVLVYGANLREAKRRCEALAGATEFEGKRIAREADNAQEA